MLRRPADDAGGAGLLLIALSSTLGSIMSATRTSAPVCADRVMASVVASVTVPSRPESTGVSVPRMTLAKFRICS